MQHYIRLIVLLILSHSGNLIFAQQYIVDSISIKNISLPLSISYFGDIVVKPGFKIGTELPFRNVLRTKTKTNGKIRVVENQLYGTINLGFFHTKGFNNAFFVNTEFGNRKIRKRGFKTEILLGAGIMRTFLDGTTYKVDDQGNVSIDKWAGSYYYMPSLSYGIGYSFENRYPKVPLSFIIKPCLFFQIPFNHYMLPHLAIDIGISYRINNSSCNFKSKYIYKSKVKK